MIKKTIVMASIIALTGGLIHSTDVNSEVVKVRSNQFITRKSMFLEHTKNKIAQRTEEIRIAKEKEEKLKQAMLLEEQAERERIAAENFRKENVAFNPYDLTINSNINEVELYNVLQAYNNGSLSQYSWAIVDCERIYDVNAFFIAALIAQESGWGESDRAIYQNNLTGHAVYNSNTEGSYFASPEESIYNTAELLYNQYLSYGGDSYYGTSIWDVNTDYCLTEDSSATDYVWSESIISIANSLSNEYHTNVKVLE